MTTRQRVIVAMIDGLDPRYAAPQAMPVFNRLASAGTSAEVEAVIPTVTNANNASISCAAWPAEHGITGNYYYDPVSGEQDYMESSRLLLQPTLMTRVTDTGGKAIVGPCRVLARGIPHRAPHLPLYPCHPQLQLCRHARGPAGRAGGEFIG
jgi:predicted AlkP superfamily phosphohydrolase/phosphomutase